MIKKEVQQAAHEFAMAEYGQGETGRLVFEALSAEAARELFPGAIAAFRGFVEGVKWALTNLPSSPDQKGGGE